MNSFDSRLIRDIMQRIGEEVAESATKLHTQVAPEYAHYMRSVGHIKGLQRAVAIIAEIQHALSSPESATEKLFIRKPAENRTYEGL